MSWENERTFDDPYPIPDVKRQPFKHHPNYFMNSDTEIYNALLDAKKSGHDLLKHFKILYPNKIPQDPINAIYVGRLDTRLQKDTNSFDHNEWEVSTDVFITTKRYDKIDRYRMLKTVTYAVMEVLQKSKIGPFLKIASQSFIYDNNNLIQVSRLSVETLENTYNDRIKSEFKKVCKILDKIDVEYISTDKKMSKKPIKENCQKKNDKE